jgi:hypothetical protein
MNKRYQVFVSSTYADLKDERKHVIQTLMEMDCIPSGMELFPAMDEEQFEFIKKVIDDCDYYLLIVGGRYGSTTAEGISYTEKEYEYAVEKGMKVVAFLHEDPDSIPSGKTDKDPLLAQRLAAFRDKVGTGRLVKFWRRAEDLPGLVALNLPKTIKTYPAVGWVRGDSAASTELLEELNNLRKQNDALRTQLEQIKNNAPSVIDNIAGLDTDILVEGMLQPDSTSVWIEWAKTMSFSDIFKIISPYLLETPSDADVNRRLATGISSLLGRRYYLTRVNEQSFQTIKIQLKALALIEVKMMPSNKGGQSMFWSLTPAGERQMMELRVIRAN